MGRENPFRGLELVFSVLSFIGFLSVFNFKHGQNNSSKTKIIYEGFRLLRHLFFHNLYKSVP